MKRRRKRLCNFVISSQQQPSPSPPPPFSSPLLPPSLPHYHLSLYIISLTKTNLPTTHRCTREARFADGAIGRRTGGARRDARRYGIHPGGAAVIPVANTPDDDGSLSADAEECQSQQHRSGRRGGERDGRCGGYGYGGGGAAAAVARWRSPRWLHDYFWGVFSFSWELGDIVFHRISQSPTTFVWVVLLPV